MWGTTLHGEKDSMYTNQNVWICAAILSVSSASASTLAGTVSLTPIKDNTLIENPTGLVSNAINDGIFSGRTGPLGGGARLRAVLAFDIASAVPRGATVTNASLTLTMVMTSSTFDFTHSLHRLLADWGEGTSFGPGGMGGEATEGDATWLHTFYPKSFWKSEGGDFEPTASASLFIPAKTGAYVFSSPGLVADVQDWVNGPSNNFGWVVIGDESTMQTSRKFASVQYEIISARPELVIDFESGPVCTPDIAPPGGNGVVDVDDLLLVINSWGPCECNADIAPEEPNGVVDVDDLLAVINGWGPCN